MVEFLCTCPRCVAHPECGTKVMVDSSSFYSATSTTTTAAPVAAMMIWSWRTPSRQVGWQHGSAHHMRARRAALITATTATRTAGLMASEARSETNKANGLHPNRICTCWQHQVIYDCQLWSLTKSCAYHSRMQVVQFMQCLP